MDVVLQSQRKAGDFVFAFRIDNGFFHREPPQAEVPLEYPGLRHAELQAYGQAGGGVIIIPDDPARHPRGLSKDQLMLLIIGPLFLPQPRAG